jgi:hypothetical protein
VSGACLPFAGEEENLEDVVGDKMSKEIPWTWSTADHVVVDAEVNARQLINKFLDVLASCRSGKLFFANTARRPINIMYCEKVHPFICK